MPTNLRRVKIAAFASAALSSGLLVAADVGGVISGAVADSSGAAVPLARVSLALEGSPIRRELVSGPFGKYRAGGLPAGSYTVTAWSGLTGASGERKVVLRDGQELEATITLSDAPVSDSDLPLERSNPLDLVRFAPEITPGQQGGNIEGWGPYGLRGNLGFNSYGQRSQDNGFLLDGVDNNDAWVRGPLILPLLEEVGSVTVDGGALRAELGHAAGAVVRIATRAGSSRLHGSAFEYWRNAELDARKSFASARDSRSHRPFQPERRKLAISGRPRFTTPRRSTRWASTSTCAIRSRGIASRRTGFRSLRGILRRSTPIR